MSPLSSKPANKYAATPPKGCHGLGAGSHTCIGVSRDFRELGTFRDLGQYCQGMLSHSDFLAHLDADSHLLAAAAAQGLEPNVPGCPGWTVRDLVAHIGEVVGQKADIVEGGYVDTWPPRREAPQDVALVDWYRSEADRLYRVLSAADPTAPAKSWADEQTVAFWIRRMAHETLVHRVDAEQAHGYESEVDPDLATDGVAELFDVFITGYPEWGDHVPSAAVVQIETGSRSWTGRFGRFTGTKGDRDYDLPTLILEQGTKPGAVISGEPDRVLLWMWGRAPLSDVEVSGDRALAHRLREVCSI